MRTGRASGIDGTGANTAWNPTASLRRGARTRIGATAGDKQPSRAGGSAATPSTTPTLWSAIGTGAGAIGQILVDCKERRRWGERVVEIEICQGIGIRL